MKRTHPNLAALARLHRIAAAIRSGKRVKDIANDEECDTKTIYRHIDFLRDYLRWNIEANNKTGYRIISEGEPLLKVPSR